MGSHKTPSENGHGQALRAGEVSRLHLARAPGSRQQCRCESSALHRKPIAACLRIFGVGYFRRALAYKALHLTRPTSRFLGLQSSLMRAGQGRFGRSAARISLEVHHVFAHGKDEAGWISAQNIGANGGLA
jgi:hypothetical protein